MYTLEYLWPLKNYGPKSFITLDPFLERDNIHRKDTQQSDILPNDILPNNTQHNLSEVVFNKNDKQRYAKCRSAPCRLAKCGGARPSFNEKERRQRDFPFLRRQNFSPNENFPNNRQLQSNS